MNNYIIIGAGIAGLVCAKTIRENDNFSKITIINGEDFLPYKRTNLSKKLLQTDKDAFNLLEEENYKELNINFIYSKCKEIVEDKNQIILENEQSLFYTDLVIATGVKVDIPKKYESDVTYFCKEKVDVLRLKKDLPNIKSICIIGGGLLGAEIANILYKENVKVTIIDKSSALLSNQLSKNLSSYLLKKVKESGVNCFLNSEIKDLNFKNKKAFVKLKNIFDIDIDLEFDGVLFCHKYKGIYIPSQLIKRDDHNRIFVDRYMQVSQNVYACGDAVVYDGKPINLWHESIDSAFVVANNIVNKNSKVEFVRNLFYRTKAKFFGDFYYSALHSNVDYLKSKQQFLLSCKNKEDIFKNNVQKVEQFEKCYTFKNNPDNDYNFFYEVDCKDNQSADAFFLHKGNTSKSELIKLCILNPSEDKVKQFSNLINQNEITFENFVKHDYINSNIF